MFAVGFSLTQIHTELKSYELVLLQITPMFSLPAFLWSCIPLGWSLESKASSAVIAIP
jgi:hypothetical protein